MLAASRVLTFPAGGFFCTVFFPEGKQLIDRIESIYGDKPEVLKTVLLSAILAAVDRLL